jgi:hypothetical protein
MALLGPLQFRADSGVAVGGGAFTRAPLAPDEDVISVSAGSSRRGWRPLTYGFLTLTDHRLIYTPLRWPISPVERGPHIFDLEEIESVAVERHFKPDFVPPVAALVSARPWPRGCSLCSTPWRGARRRNRSPRGNRPSNASRFRRVNFALPPGAKSSFPARANGSR